MLDPTDIANADPLNTGIAPVVSIESTKASASSSGEKLKTLAAAIELVSELDASTVLTDAAQKSAELLMPFLSCSRVVILWRSRLKSPLQIIADTNSVTSGSDRQTEERLLLAAAEEISSRGTKTCWPVRDATDRHALLAVSQLASALPCKIICGARMNSNEGVDVGVMLAIDPPETESVDRLGLLALPLASRLHGIEKTEPSAIESACRSLAKAARSRRRVLVALAVAVAFLLMFLPVRYRVSAEIELQPTQHRFVAVPFDGPLASAHVQPGDEVAKGDLLARINPREIEYELAGVRADLNRSIQEKKGQMVEHNAAGSRIATLESERLRLQTELLLYRRDNLEIRSPIAGVVVSGDLRQSEGMPMSRGETLFEIAPLGKMRVEIAVPEDEFTHVQAGMPVRFYLHAMPNRKIDGTISRLHPSAERRDQDSFFIAEVEIEDPDNILRPGMRGRAKIAAGRHPLGWNLFHKAYYALRDVVGV